MNFFNYKIHTCLPALARQARLTGGSRAGRNMIKKIHVRAKRFHVCGNFVIALPLMNCKIFNT